MNEKLLNEIIEKAKENFKNSKEFMPAFFVGTDKDFNVIGAFFENERSKDLTAQAIKQLAKKIDADFVLFVSESWTLAPEYVEDFMKNRQKYKSISDHPKAYDVLAFTLETKFGYKTALVKILPNRELGELKWMESDTMDGRFSNFLGPKLVRH